MEGRKKHLLVILPNADYDEFTRVPPSKEFFNTLSKLLRRVDANTLSISIITFRKVTADLAQMILHASGHYNIPMSRFTLLRKALAQDSFGDAQKCDFELITIDEDLFKDDADAWYRFCVRMVHSFRQVEREVKVGCCQMSHIKSPHDFWRYPAFDKDSFIKHWAAPSVVYILPGYQSIDSVTPAIDVVKRIKLTLEKLKRDDQAVAVLVGGKSGDSAISEAMVMCGLLLVSDVAPRRDLPSRVAIVPAGVTWEEKARVSHEFVSDVAIGASKLVLVLREELLPVVMAEYEKYDSFVDIESLPPVEKTELESAAEKSTGELEKAKTEDAAAKMPEKAPEAGDVTKQTQEVKEEFVLNPIVEEPEDVVVEEPTELVAVLEEEAECIVVDEPEEIVVPGSLAEEQEGEEDGDDVEEIVVDSREDLFEGEPEEIIVEEAEEAMAEGSEAVLEGDPDRIVEEEDPEIIVEEEEPEVIVEEEEVVYEEADDEAADEAEDGISSEARGDVEVEKPAIIVETVKTESPDLESADADAAGNTTGDDAVAESDEPNAVEGATVNAAPEKIPGPRSFSTLTVSVTKQETIEYLEDYIKYHSDSVPAKDRLENLKEGVDELTVREHPIPSAEPTSAKEKEKLKSKRESKKSVKKELSRKKSKGSKKKKDVSTTETKPPAVKAKA